MPFYVHFTTDHMDPFPPLASLHQFEGATPMEAVENALKVIPPPVENDGEQF
jgi:hypothetical protein